MAILDKFQGRSLLKFKSELRAQDCISENMRYAIELWGQMYTNEAPWIKRDIHSLNLANGICKEFARLVTLELKSKITDDAELNELYQKKVVSKLRNTVEKACAKGAVVIKPRIDGYGDIQVDFISADNFLPIAFDSNGNILCGVFASFCMYGNDYYTLIKRHELYDGTVNVDIRVYRSRDKESLGKRIRSNDFPPCWQGITESYTAQGVCGQLFTYFKMPMANCIDEDSPLGVSVFAGAEELIQDADEQYSSLKWEYKGGEMAIYANSDAVMTEFEDENGEAVSRMPEHSRRLIRTFEGEQADFYKEFTPQLRDNNYLSGLNRILKNVEFNCQLAYGTLSDPQNTDKTAEEIRASKQRSYSAVSDMQKALGDALDDVVKVLDFYNAIRNDKPANEHTVTHEFDDSLVCDRGTEYKERLELMKNGVCSPWEVRMWYFGEDEATAKKAIEDMELDL